MPQKTFLLSLSLLSISLLSGCVAMMAGGAAATGVIVAQDRRTTGTIVEDKSIQLKALQAIRAVGQNQPGVHVSAASYNGRVLLVGQVPSLPLRANIEKQVRRIRKVRYVHNEITLESPTSMLMRSTDSWITTQIKSEMAMHPLLNPTHIKAITEKGVVYLLGIVSSQEEAIAVNIARHTKGVKKVVSIFDPLPPTFL